MVDNNPNEYPFSYICNECGDDFDCKTETKVCANCSSLDIRKI